MLNPRREAILLNIPGEICVLILSTKCHPAPNYPAGSYALVTLTHHTNEWRTHTLSGDRSARPEPETPVIKLSYIISY